MTWVSTSIADTFACASAAPDASTTVPAIALDVSLCAAIRPQLTKVNERQKARKLRVVPLHFVVTSEWIGEACEELTAHRCLHQEPHVQHCNDPSGEPCHAL